MQHSYQNEERNFKDFVDMEETDPLNPKPFMFKNYEEELDVPITSTCFNNSDVQDAGKQGSKRHPIVLTSLILFSLIILVVLFFNSTDKSHELLMKTASAGTWSSAKVAPFSTVNPDSIGFTSYDRRTAKPGPVFAKMFDTGIPLPTNSWYENFLLGIETNSEQNVVFQVPYILDTAGKIPGIRMHPCYVQAFSKQVMVTIHFFHHNRYTFFKPFSYDR